VPLSSSASRAGEKGREYSRMNEYMLKNCNFDSENFDLQP